MASPFGDFDEFAKCSDVNEGFDLDSSAEAAPIADAPLPEMSDSPPSDTEVDERPAKARPPNGRPNRIKKDDGRDAKPDPNDQYMYEGQTAHQLFKQAGENYPSAKLIFEVCKCLEEREPRREKLLTPGTGWPSGGCGSRTLGSTRTRSS
jgi:hypothetical protein